MGDRNNGENTDRDGGGHRSGEERKGRIVATTKPEKAYEPTKHEQEVINRVAARRAKAPPMKFLNGPEGAELRVEHADEIVGRVMLMEAFGATEAEFLDPLMIQVANAASKGREVDVSATSFALSVVRGVEPRDQVEAMLAAQMAAVHTATMTFARRLNHTETIQQQDSAARAFNKLARTFATQMETLKRYRTGGEQKVTVRHVTVKEGGQAIVGNVTTGGRGGDETRG